MMVQVRYRTMALFALAISLLVLAALPQMAGAESRRGEVPGQEKRAAAAAPAADQGANAASAPAPTSADSAAAAEASDASTHDADSGPGGQVCDGDPDNEPGDGGNYENTCDAGPSENGVGDGEANGKPCAGCVGNADDKNPPGQADSGPTDENNGYECDEKGRSENEGNNGVGVGNPAHTGCDEEPVTEDPKCPNGKPMPASGNTADCDPKCPNGDAMPASGRVEDCTTVQSSGGETVVLGEVLARPVEVLGVQLSRPEAAAVAPATLARTGGFQLITLLQAALVLAALGLGLTAAARLRRRDGMIDIASRLG